jgi:hypothetical protein
MYQALFATGSTVSFALKKEAIISEFKLKGVWSLVVMPPAIPGAPPIPIIETTMNTMPPPPTYVADHMVAHNNLVINYRNEGIARIDLRFPAGVAGHAVERRKELNQLDVDMAKETMKEAEVRHRFELEFIARTLEYEKALKIFEDKQATCLGVFHSTLSEAVRNRVGPLLSQQRFREAWFNLCEMYSPGAGGQATIESVYQYYMNYVWRGGFLPEHIVLMERLAENAVAAGHAISEQTRIFNLIRSIEQSPHQEYKNQIDFIRESNPTLIQIVDRLTRRSNELATARETAQRNGTARVSEVTISEPRVAAAIAPKYKDKKKKNNRSAAATTAPRDTRSLQCDNCGKTGHVKADCFNLKPCLFCQRMHNSLYCADNPHPGDKEKLRERRAAVQGNSVAVVVGTPAIGQQVNLTGRFTTLNPRPI